MPNRSLQNLLTALIGALSIGSGAAAAASLPGRVGDLIATRCLGCHDSDTREAGLDLAKLGSDFADRATFETWVKVCDRVQAGEMPPSEAEFPAAERDRFVNDLSQMLHEVEGEFRSSQGRAALRRLTRTEYENTLRDLFDLPGLNVKDILPEDGRTDGFDKVGDTLELSVVQLAKYLEAADVVLDAAIARTPQPPEPYRARLRLAGGLARIGGVLVPLWNKQPLDEIDYAEVRRQRLPEREKLLDRSDALGMLSHAGLDFRPQFAKFSPLHSGFYRLRHSVWSFVWDKGNVLPSSKTLSVALLAEERVLGYFDAPSLESAEHELVCWLNAGEMIELNPADLWILQLDPIKYTGPGVALDWLDVEGPVHETWPPVSHRRLFGDLPFAEADHDSPVAQRRRASTVRRKPGALPREEKRAPIWTVVPGQPEEDAKRLLADFLPRAFRRPVAADESARYAALAKDRLHSGDCFEEALRAAYRVALCSPDFLYLIESPGPLDDYALASRLSYFLWLGPPDDELLRLASQSRLREPGQLRAQVDRMLADPKSERFVADFLDQWLNLREIEATSPDGKLYPEFRPGLQHAMVAESRAFFRELLDNDLSCANVVLSEFAMLNRRLAEHYGVAGVTDSTMQRVTLPPESRRGGFLTQASVLKVTADGTTTSPVKRGVWVADRILGARPPPPPPNIPGVDPDVRGTTTIRELLAKHRDSAECASCHAKIDPPGFALESFDVIGGWRTRYRSTGEEGDPPDRADFFGAPPRVTTLFRHGPGVDPSGTMSDGKGFDDVRDMQEILLGDIEAIAGNLARRLVVYATGAPIGYTDRRQVAEIVRQSQSTNYGVRSLVQHVVDNPLFQCK